LRTPQEEEKLFYEGYGSTQVNQAALAHYRYERIVQEIPTYCDQIFSGDQGGKDREQEFEYLASNFTPNGVLEIAEQSGKT
jgi:spectinomycin phosphotransferase